MFIRRSLAWLLVLGLAGTLPAQDDPPADEPAAEVPAEEPAAEEPAAEEPAAEEPTNDEPTNDGPAANAADFGPLFEEWKGILKELRKLQTEYLTAGADERRELEETFRETYERGTAMAGRLQAAGEAAFAEDPKDQEIADFLASTALGNAREDNYEEALRLAEILVEGGYSNPEVYAVAAQSAYRTMNFDAAEKYFPKAEGQIFAQERAMALEEIEELRQDWVKELEIREAEAEADDLPRVKFETNKGDVVIELFENEAPNTTANIISLVEKGFYDGVVFHRVLPGFMAQGGDPTGTGGGGPGYNIPCECYTPEYRRHFRGSLSMAHAGRDTGGSQFFMTFHATTHLNAKHTVFGRVVEGMEVLSKLQRRDPAQENQPEPDKIVKATVVRKRDHEYQPETIAEQ